ncbi:MAG TPA: leucyl aminopeptidase family protein [Thermohalobaculum sp.]|nr:leucyl aminopeptidase family protein [Thermohalobaculum sp.]
MSEGRPQAGPQAARGEPVPIRLVGPEDIEAALAGMPGMPAAWVRANGFRGRTGSWLAIPGADGSLARVLVGHGAAGERRRERFHLGAFARAAPPGRYRLEGPLDREAAEEAALAWRLGRYRFDRYKGTDKAGEARGEAVLETPAGVDAGRLERIAEGVCLARDLINAPANELGPAALEQAARDLALRHGAEVAVTAGEALIEANLPLIHAVGRAGPQAPRLLDLRWGDPGHPKVTLVGKGVCFDTGGLNLKPGSSMELMKKDMGGAACVMGLAHMVMGLGLPLRLRLLIPAVENSVAAWSMRPGDILRSRQGLSVEIGNTDAEGRLVLADALALAGEEDPALVVDMATLTGAARVALGPDLPAFFTDDEALAGELMAASARVADPLWRLPLWPAYEADIEPEIADLDNAPRGGFAGAITAALFLKRFAGARAWVHFDIYGWTPKARPGRPRGGECQAARAVLALLETRYGGSR